MPDERKQPGGSQRGVRPKADQYLPNLPGNLRLSRAPSPHPTGCGCNTEDAALSHIDRGRTRYALERLDPKRGWLTASAHGNTLRLAVRDLPHRYDMVLGVIYDAAAIAQQSEVA